MIHSEDTSGTAMSRACRTMRSGQSAVVTITSGTSWCAVILAGRVPSPEQQKKRKKTVSFNGLGAVDDERPLEASWTPLEASWTP